MTVIFVSVYMMIVTS